MCVKLVNDDQGAWLQYPAHLRESGRNINMMQDVEEPNSVKKLIGIARFLNRHGIECDIEIHFLRALPSDTDNFGREVEGIDLGAGAGQSNRVFAKSASRNDDAFPCEIRVKGQSVGFPIGVPPASLRLGHDREGNRLVN